MKTRNLFVADWKNFIISTIYLPNNIFTFRCVQLNLIARNFIICQKRRIQGYKIEPILCHVVGSIEIYGQFMVGIIANRK